MKSQLLEDENHLKEQSSNETDFPFKWIRTNLVSDILDTLSTPNDIVEENEI